MPMRRIARLTLAVEFVTSTIRAIADGKDMKSSEVLDTAGWAKQEIEEFLASVGADQRVAAEVTLKLVAEDKEAA
jgi:hypothetical protein